MATLFSTLATFFALPATQAVWLTAITILAYTVEFLGAKFIGKLVIEMWRDSWQDGVLGITWGLIANGPLTIGWLAWVAFSLYSVYVFTLFGR